MRGIFVGILSEKHAGDMCQMMAYRTNWEDCLNVSLSEADIKNDSMDALKDCREAGYD